MDNNVNIEDIIQRIKEEEESFREQSSYYNEFLPEFIDKCNEDIDIIENNILALEKEPDNKEVLDAIFRSFHNIKGAAGFVAQENIQSIAHYTENIVEYCRSENEKVNSDTLNLILNSCDLLKQLCQNTSLNSDEEFIKLINNHAEKLNNFAEYSNSSVNDINELYLDFIGDIKAHLELLEQDIKNINTSENCSDKVESIFKKLHTIKGLSGFANLLLLQKITDRSEILIDKYRQSNKEFSANIVSILSQSVSVIKEACDDYTLINSPNYAQKVDNLIEKIDTEANLSNEATCQIFDDEFLEDFILETQEHIEAIEVCVLNLEKDYENKETINSLFRAFHTVKGLAGFVEQHLIQNIAHKTENLLDSCRKGEITPNNIISDFILKSSDYLKKACEQITITTSPEFIKEVETHLDSLEQILKDSTTSEHSQHEEKKLGEILISENNLSKEDVEEILDKQQNEYKELKFGEIAVIENKVEPKKVYNAIQSQQKRKNAGEEYMRIATSKVDNLVDIVGELIITNSLIEQDALKNIDCNGSFLANLNRMTRITKDLQNIAMDFRMIPLKSTFQKISRVARDTIINTGKDINFVSYGDEIEIDRAVTERLLDPLLHLVKNAISHGIEDTTKDRELAGKPAKGNVTLNAFNKRGYVYIEIIDDGKGIDLNKIHQKAIEKELVDANRDYSPKEILEFVFLPGFSTAKVVDNISGRGVGMDVVKTEISKIGGKVEIENNPGQGCTFILKIPVNHAVMNGTVVNINGSNYILPTINVKEIFQPKENQWVFTQGTRSMIKLRNSVIPLVSLQNYLGLPEEENPILIIIVELDQKFRALPVKNILGRQEIVVKPASKEFSQLKYISGMSILGDGKVSLILDVEHMFEGKGVG